MSISAPPRPYKGLVPFGDGELDALFFFGREREREIIVANLIASRLTVLYGPSGVGKTSLLRAGVAHHLRSLGDADVAVFSAWAEDPTEEIDDAIARADGRDLYLILDQIEEYFLYHDRDDPLARRLPEIVQTRGLRLNVLLGVREDALAKLDFFKGRIPNLFSNYLRLDHLDRVAAREAILGPLRRLGELDGEGYDAEPELVETLLDQVATGRIEYGLAGRGIAKGRDEPARIEAPFLQLVLERLWDEERTAGSSTLRLETLERLGGAETIVREHLNRALESLDPAQQELAAEIFDHLVTPSGTKIAHGLTDLAGYARTSRDDLGDVLAQLSRARIVRPLDEGGPDARFEIFHDVLAGGVLAWRTNFEAQRELERERVRRRRAVAIASIALLALAAVAAIAVFALTQRDRAEEQANSARARELAARALTQLDVEPQDSLRLAVEAATTERTRQTEDVLRTTLLAARERKVLPTLPSASFVDFDARGRVLVPTEDGVRVYRRSGAVQATLDLPLAAGLLALSADHSLAVIADGRNAVIRDTVTGDVVRAIRQPGEIVTARFDADRRRVAVVAKNSSGRLYARIFRVADGALLNLLRHRGTMSVAFSPNGRLFATGSTDETTRLWRLPSGRPVRTLSDPAGSGYMLAVEFSPDGKMLATASQDSVVRIWEVASGIQRYMFLGHTNETVAVAWSPDGEFVADGSEDGRAQILDVSGPLAGQVVAVLAGHDAGIRAIAYSRDGRWIATVARDGTARVWDGRGEHRLRVIARQAPGITRATLSPDGRFAVTAGAGGAMVVDVRRGRRSDWVSREPVTVARFDAEGDVVVGVARQARVQGVASGGGSATPLHRKAVTDAVPVRNGVATASEDGWVRIFDGGGNMTAHVDHGGPIDHVRVRHDGLVASGARDGTLRFWRPGREAIIATGHEGPLTALEFSPDGTMLASGGADGIVRLWDPDTGSLRTTLEPHAAGVTDLVFRPGGRQLVSTSGAQEVRMSNVETGALVRDFVGHFAAVNSAAFSPNGRWLVTTSAISAAIWDPRSSQPFAYLRGQTIPSLRTAEFTPDGKAIVTAGDDGTVRRYACEVCGSLDDLLALARARLAAARPVR